MPPIPARTSAATPETFQHAERSRTTKSEWWGPEDKTPRSIRYTASFKADKAGKYLVLAAASGSDHYKVSVDGKPIIEQVQVEGQHPESASVDLGDGQTVTVVADYLPGFVGNRFGLGIANEPDMISEDAKKFASVADAVVVAVGFNPSTESEGLDRTFSLPWGQDALDRSRRRGQSAHHRHTHRRRRHGHPRAGSTKVPALLHIWYPGQEGGTAIADVLFGKHDPEGKLPVSFDRSWEDNPSFKATTTRSRAPTPRSTSPRPTAPPVDYVIPHVKYDDKLMVGYRYWTTTGKHPLYPFGFGLSYTTFSFSKLEVPSAAASGSPVTVSFDVTNTGSVAGAEVAQLYVSDPSAKAQRPERELKGFAEGPPRSGRNQARHAVRSMPAPSATGTKRRTNGPSTPASS